jgi:23S rRNA pseudouridine1911/1915/1917 synthase
MLKISSHDVLLVMRRFNLAGIENVPRNVERLKITEPNPKNTLVSFMFNKNAYYLLFDDQADDDANYIVEQIQTDRPNLIGELLVNPHDDESTYGMPFQGKDCYLFVIKSPKTRLDKVLVDKYPELSRSTWQKHIKAGHVTVNGELASSAKQEVLETDKIATAIPADEDFSDSTLPILYIDDNVIVINKPIGVLTHSKGTINEEFTVADFFARYSDYNVDSNRAGIVHRLDRDTSGVMIGARNLETATMLQKQFADRKTKKTYVAIIVGRPKSDHAKLDLPIARNPSAPSTFKVDAKGKSAITTYEVIAFSDNKSLVKLTPQTGRTHQLRVHMKYIGTPILGDKVYGKKADRLYLHARSLEITIPTSDRRTFEAPVPSDFVALFPEAEEL